MNSCYVYILSSKPRGALYIGVTNELKRRYAEHLSGDADSFTKKYKVIHLVYYEETENIEAAIKREKQLKNWRRQWKINLIEATNPQWKDLSRYYRMGSETRSE